METQRGSDLLRLTLWQWWCCGSNPGLRWQSRVCFLSQCLCGGPESAQPAWWHYTYQHAALPLPKQWMKLHSTSESLEILCQSSLWGPELMVSGWGPLYKLTCSSFTPGPSSLHGSDTSGALPHFPANETLFTTRPSPDSSDGLHLKSPP